MSGHRKGALPAHTSTRHDSDIPVPADPVTRRVMEKLYKPPHDAIAHDDAKAAQAKQRVTLRKFSWEK